MKDCCSPRACLPFTVLPLQVRQLREAGRLTLRACAAFQKLVQSLQVQEAFLAAAGDADAANSTH